LYREQAAQQLKNFFKNIRQQNRI
ncbi:MAG: tRNA-specific adenosine deaminase, partial [Lactobacillus iners]|nr:tRNA-specific adenosine deaminase [Lactobacillus iners]